MKVRKRLLRVADVLRNWPLYGVGHPVFKTSIGAVAWDCWGIAASVDWYTDGRGSLAAAEIAESLAYDGTAAQ